MHDVLIHCFTELSASLIISYIYSKKEEYSLVIGLQVFVSDHRNESKWQTAARM